MVAAVVTPAAEKLLHRIGYRRVLKLLGALLSLAAVTAAAVIALAVASTPVAAPVAIAAKLLPDVADLFGAGDNSGAEMSVQQFSAAGSDAAITCRTRVTPTSSLTAAAEQTGEVLALNAAAPNSAPVAKPISINHDGSINRLDARALIDPVLPGTSALTANVWFLYRLAGLGDWDTFVAAYKLAGLHDDDEGSNAPLMQVQALNASGVDMEQYRLTAAALTAAGQFTGRLKDPYPGYRELVAMELVSGCLDDPAATTLRATLPPPSITTAPAPVEEVSLSSAGSLGATGSSVMPQQNGFRPTSRAALA